MRLVSNINVRLNAPAGFSTSTDGFSLQTSIIVGIDDEYLSKELNDAECFLRQKKSGIR